MQPTKPDTEALSNTVSKLFVERMTAARQAGHISSDAVQVLIAESRELMTRAGCTKRDADGVLCLVHSMIHWDWHQPTDEIFKTLLDFELTDFWKEKGIAGDYDATNVS